MKSPNEFHVMHNGSGIYYLDNIGLLWHESMIADKPTLRQMSLLHIKFIAKFKITIK